MEAERMPIVVVNNVERLGVRLCRVWVELEVTFIHYRDAGLMLDESRGDQRRVVIVLQWSVQLTVNLVINTKDEHRYHTYSFHASMQVHDAFGVQTVDLSVVIQRLHNEERHVAM
jgi:hypothetical protein